MNNFDGGIRGNSFVSGGFLPPAVRGTRFDGLVALWDWYHTFCSLAVHTYKNQAPSQPPNQRPPNLPGRRPGRPPRGGGGAAADRLA